jgi:hypothetical protein
MVIHDLTSNAAINFNSGLLHIIPGTEFWFQRVKKRSVSVTSDEQAAHIQASEND